MTALFGDTAVQASAPAGGNWAGLSGLMMPAVAAPGALQASQTSRPDLMAGMVGTSLIQDNEPATLTVMGASELSWQMGKNPGTQGATGLLGVAPAAEVNAADTSDAMRLQLMLPREAITALTRRLAGMSGTGQAVAWGGLTASALASTIPVQGRLDLREFFKADGSLTSLSQADALDAALSDAPGAPPSLTAEGARTAASPLTLTAEGTPVASQAGQRLEHYQQLADRLGQALAQRLQAQIERGEWKVQMRMDPASLGRIDMELDMRAGGLDAVFRSDNPLTRELIAQGLPKLKESLSQSGTAVANVWVNGDSARQSGGNPTPSKNPSNGAWKQGEDDRGQGGQTVDLAPVAGVRQGSASSDWDVLA